MHTTDIPLIKPGKLHIVVSLTFVSTNFSGICKNSNFWWDIKLCKIVASICTIIHDCPILSNRDSTWITDITVFKVGRYTAESFQNISPVRCYCSCFVSRVELAESGTRSIPPPTKTEWCCSRPVTHGSPPVASSSHPWAGSHRLRRTAGRRGGRWPPPPCVPSVPAVHPSP